MVDLAHLVALVDVLEMDAVHVELVVRVQHVPRHLYVLHAILDAVVQLYMVNKIKRRFAYGFMSM